MTLLGRESEQALIADALGRTRQGGTWLTIVGPAGIGKTSLLQAAADNAKTAGMTIVRATCSPFEQHLSFVVLQQLLQPLLAGLDRLPAGHAAALRTAFGLDYGSVSAHPLHVALATVELLADAADRRPLLAIVDDLHWCDRPSFDAIGFIGRRIAAEPIVLIGSTRPVDGSMDADAATTTVALGPLEQTPAKEFLRLHTPSLNPHDAQRLLLLAAGNPLALRELPRGLGQSSDSGNHHNSGYTLTTRLEDAFGDRVSQLSGDGQLALSIAALHDSDSMSEIVNAARLLLTDERAAIEEGLAMNLITIEGNRLRFDHPLTRSAVVQRGNPLLHTRVHLALSQSLTRSSPERATWHRAAASLAPDDAVAAALEANAETACAQGRAAAAIPWLLRAAELTRAEAQRGHCLLRAAELSFEIGDHVLVASVTSQARALSLEPSLQARLAVLDSAFNGGGAGDVQMTERLIVAASAARSQGRPDLSASLLITALRSQYWRGVVSETSDRIRAELTALDLPPDDPRQLHGVALLDSYASGHLIAEHLNRWSARAPTEPALTGLLALSAFVASEFDQAAHFARLAVAGLRAEGRIALLAQALVFQTSPAVYLGQWDTAFTASHEALMFAEETNQPMFAAAARLGIGNVTALRGDHETAAAMADHVEEIAYAISSAGLINAVQQVRGLTALGRGEPQEAFDQMGRMFDPSDRAYHPVQCVRVVDYYAEAARGCQQIDAARRVLRAVEERVADSPALGARRAIALATAWLADDDNAESAFAMAAELGPVSPPWYRARLELARGMWLRRQQRVVEARVPLRTARISFTALGASAWSDRATRELAAAGDQATRVTAPVWSELSAQELLIARLAAQGLSNREIGSQLYLSHRTVGSHLYRIFPKLGLRNRTELGDALRVLIEQDE